MSHDEKKLPLKTIRLIDWISETLCRTLSRSTADKSRSRSSLSVGDLDSIWIQVASKQGAIMAEVKEVIDFPEFEQILGSDNAVPVTEVVRQQLRCYVLAIARKYANNAFHNFDVRLCSVDCKLLTKTYSRFL
jgi:hypothetical protein